ncbi:MAG: PilZ domain-containing protein [Chloroflexi bacterium]|nr:PilZ domain-containing protein [Chloroflexota bacterium]
MPERRRIHRKYLMYYTRIYDMPKGDLIGHLVDITPGGAMVISEHPIPAGRQFELRMELSMDVTEKPYMSFQARSIWCQQDIDPRFYNTGFELTGVSSDDAAIIEAIVEAYGFRDN